MRASFCGPLVKGAQSTADVEGGQAKTPQSVLTIDEQTERTPMM